MRSINDLMSLMNSATAAGPASNKMIARAEQELDIRFPPSYREFLATYGAALCPGFEIAGLFSVHDEGCPPLWMDVAIATRQMRRHSHGQIPADFVVISDDGGDFTFYLETANTNSSGECPVVVLGPGVDSVVVAQDFFDYIVLSFEGKIES